MSLLYSVENHVARVTINRPEVLNSIDRETEAELLQTWEKIERDPEVRCVVLTGAGERGFCAGADMKSGNEVTGLEYWLATRPGGFGGIALRDTLDVPVIGRINGHALGGGMEMVLGCDIVIAAEHATFGLPEPRFGRLPLEGGIAQLTRRIPYVHAMGMMLTGRRIKAKEAQGFGLVNEVVPLAELDAAVDRWVADVLACAPLSLRAIKQMVRRGAGLSPQEAQMLRLPALIAALNSTDQDEGVQAFREKRAPQWTGGLRKTLG